MTSSRLDRSYILPLGFAMTVSMWAVAYVCRLPVVMAPSWLVLGLMLAVQSDFKAVLKDKNATEITVLVVQSLRESQFEPMLITNGDKNFFAFDINPMNFLK